MSAVAFIASSSSRRLAILISITVTIALLLVGTCQYETNDHMAMISLITGKNGLNASFDAIFLSLPFSALLYQLYHVAGSVPWFGLVLYSCLIIACAIGIMTIQNSEIGPVEKISCGIAFLGFYAFLVCQLNFASTSLFLWLSTSAALTSANLKGYASGRKYLAYGCLMAISYLIRPSIFTVSLLFSAPLFASFCVARTPKKIALFLAPLLLAIVVSYACDRIFRSAPEYLNFLEFNKARSNFLDMHTGEPNSNTLKALSASGWGIYDYLIGAQWWIHDGRIFNTETLRQFNIQNAGFLSGQFTLTSCIDSLKMFKYHLGISVICMIHLFSSLTTPSRIKGWRLIAVVVSLIITCMAIIFMSGIRFPHRVAIPVFASLILLSSISSSLFTTRPSRRNALRNSIAGCCVLAVVASTIITQTRDWDSRVFGKSLRTFTTDSLRHVQKATSPETIFVTLNVAGYGYQAERVNPLAEFNDAPDIIDFPNGWLVASQAYNLFLKQYGFDDRNHVVQRMINNKRVVFAYWQHPEMHFEAFMDLFKNHLSARYGAEFSGSPFKIEVIYDNRETIGNFGWIFFRIYSS